MEVLRNYQRRIEQYKVRLAVGETLSLEEEFDYAEAIHFIDIHNFREAPEDKKQRFYNQAVESHRKVHDLEKKIYGPDFISPGLIDPETDRRNGVH